MNQNAWSDVALRELRHFWSRLGPRRQAVCLGIFLTGLLSIPLTQAFMSRRQEWLLGASEFSPAELLQMEAAWAVAGLSEYRVVDAKVRVPAAGRAKYLAALVTAKAIPRPLSSELGEELRKPDFFESPRQRVERIEFAKNRELANCLCGLKDVEEAFVRFDEAPATGLAGSPRTAALVVVRPTNGAVLLPERIGEIRKIVAASRLGLEPDQVTVTDLGSGQAYRGPLAEALRAAAPEAQPLWEQTCEHDWNLRVARIVAPIQGAKAEADVRIVAGDTVSQEIRIQVSVPRAYYERVHMFNARAQGNVAKAPTVEELVETEQRVNAEITRQIRDLAPVARDKPTTVTTPAGQVLDVAIQRLDGPVLSPPTSSTVFLTSDPNSLVAAGIVAMALAGIFIGVGFVRDLASDRRDVAPTKLAPSLGEAARGSEPDASIPMSSSPESVAAGDAAQDALIDSVHGATDMQRELNTMIRENPKAAAEMLRRWTQEAA